ncbi:MAG: RidA family protein [Bdellovibrionales bacterium]|jgi:2-iminobutanoate/2-iminopropanoate deaminase|nr:RidA family protein [Bdellovibrionales bacterium]MBT3526213.1 RidA family protein [Bdellovibrionales bacterium]MBT7668187.1 RidA family protein [Bdellovibrionales bacterium]MBT7765850.1 RidA family protein [Bdellovibrionales bacterium]
MARPENIINSSDAPKAVGTYSQGVKFGGVCYFSGQIGLDAQSMEMASNFQGQLDQILVNIDALLASEDLIREDILKTTVFLTDLANFGMVNQAYQKYFADVSSYPARSCVEVSALPKEALVEIEVIASK